MVGIVGEVVESRLVDCNHPYVGRGVVGNRCNFVDGIRWDGQGRSSHDYSPVRRTLADLACQPEMASTLYYKLTRTNNLHHTFCSGKM